MSNFSSLFLRRICGGLFALLLWALPVQAQWTNNQAAVNVIGQPNFTTNAPGLTASTFNAPVSVAVDLTTGKVFVADLLNHRILRFSSAAAFANGQAAEGVLGQANFTSRGWPDKQWIFLRQAGHFRGQQRAVVESQTHLIGESYALIMRRPNAERRACR
ncbi:MAG: hypothetical protein U0Y68_12155 [Blastocatellia bacterium]